MTSVTVRMMGFALLTVGLGAPAAIADEPDEISVSGQVLGQDGQPYVGAKIYVSTYTPKSHAEPPLRATSGSDGRFSFEVTRSELDSNETVVAVADDCGPDWGELSSIDASGDLPPLRLVKDEPVVGTVSDLEGQPISGATVRLVRVRKLPGENLDLWIKDMQKVRSKGVFDLERSTIARNYERTMKTVWGVLGLPQSVTTDADGRFRLSGFGRDRVVELSIEPPGHEFRRVTVATRNDDLHDLPPFTYAARFDFQAAPAKPIQGHVRDKASGRPVAGVEVGCAFISPSGAITDLIPGSGSMATTDEQGRYLLAGTPKSKQYHLGTAGSSFFAGTRVVDDTAGLEPITVDFELERGVMVRGRVGDKLTAKPVPATIYYVPRPDNPHLNDYPTFAMIGTSVVDSEKDGSFALPAIPGRGLICVRATYDRFFRAEFDGAAAETPILLQFATFHAILPVEVTEDDAQATACDVALDPGLSLNGLVCTAEGKSLDGAFVAGLTSAPSVIDGSPVKQKLTGSEFSAVALDPRHPRTLVFWHEEQWLGKAVLARGDEADRPSVCLEPFGAVSGKLVDSAGQPLDSIRLEARYGSRVRDTLPLELVKSIPGLVTPPLALPQATTEQDGRFRIEGLIPGLSYDLFARLKEGEALVAADLVAEGAECKDLGQVRAEKQAASAGKEGQQ